MSNSWTPETNRIQTMHLTADELAALKAAKHGWLAVRYNGTGLDIAPPAWHSTVVYRAKPAPVTQDVVPWDAIDKRWNWHARDKNESMFFYDVKPEIEDNGWEYIGDMTYSPELLAGYIRGTCDWRDSLQQRPTSQGDDE